MRVALVGLGYVATHHYDAVRTAGVSAILGCDVNPKLAAAFASRPGVESVVSDIDDLIALKPDVAHVLTPPDVHYPVASRLVAAGIDVLLEKPMCDRSTDIERLRNEAQETGALLATSHNFLFYRIWERLKAVVESGTIGSLRSIDVCMRRPFGPLHANDTRPWALRASRNMLFEMAPHAFACALDLTPSIDVVHVETASPQDLPNGVRFFRHWDALAAAGDAMVRINLSYEDAYSEFFVHVRGTIGSVIADFDHNTVVVQSRSAGGPFELADQGLRSAGAYSYGAVSTLLATAAQKVGSKKFGPPYEESIGRAVAQFLADRSHGRELDRRLSPELGQRVVTLAERIADLADLPEPARVSSATTVPDAANAFPQPDPTRPSALIIGGTGFIGTALVRRLAADGVRTRVVARQLEATRRRFSDFPSVEVVEGDLEQTAELVPHLAGVDVVYHLAYCHEETWDGVLCHEVEPTKRLIDECARAEIGRFVYASSSAIFDAGDASRTITEETPASPGMIAVALYARAKVEIEAYLLERHRSSGFPAVIIRPAIVLGVDSDPCHWGIAAWPYSNVAIHWGSGRNALPIVLVEDVADGFAKALDRPGIEGRCFNLSSPACITAREYLDELALASGQPISQKQRSTRLMYASQLLKWAIKLPGPNRKSIPRWADCNGRSFASTFDCSATEKALDWHPETDRKVLIDRGIIKPAEDWRR